MELEHGTNWVIKQTEHNIAQFEKSMETRYPESARYLHDPEKYYTRIAKECNYLDAVRVIDWDRYLKPGAVVLDLGGGSGWLAVFLSQFQHVAKVYLLDSSRYFLEMMPAIAALAQGQVEKIVPIEGLFTPLFFPDESLDMVVMSSALHHADNLEGTLKEIRRVLKKDGHLFILNETPTGNVTYVITVLKQSLKIFLNTIFRKYMTVSQALSSSGFLYDPYLHDITYPVWYWYEAIARSGFQLQELFNTHLATIKGDKNGIKLKHFICQKAAGKVS